MAVALKSGAIVAKRYRLDRLLGRGGMGAVWSANVLGARGPVALKFVSNVASPEHRLRFLREARAACAVHHPNVRQVHDVFDLEDGSLVMSMEYLEGEPLARMFEREGKMPVLDLYAIMVQVVSAVGAAHAIGIVHRDLKPENVFVCAGPDRRVKILDFGVAKLASAEVAGSIDMDEVTATGSLVGTPTYMAPEQLFGEHDLDHRADIWSLGVIFYRGLSGVLPTGARTIGQALKRILRGEIQPVGELVPELPEDIARLVTRMLARSPNERPGDLCEVWDVLTRHVPPLAPRFAPAAAVLQQDGMDAGPVTFDPSRRAPPARGSSRRSDPPRR